MISLMATGCTAPGADAASDTSVVPTRFGFPSTLTLSVEGQDRDFLLEAPIGVHKDQIPVALILHGGGGSAELMQARSQSLSRQLRAQGYLVVYLNGSSRFNRQNLRTWNADHCCAWAQKENVDEAAYLDAVLAELSTNSPIDLSRTFLIGHSNGAMLAWRVASRLKVPPRGIIAISGGMFADQPPLPDVTSALAIHTQDDEVVSFDGSSPGKSDRWRSAPHLSFPQSEQRMLLDKACSQTMETHPAAGVTISSSTCEQGSQLVFIDAETGGHEWPKSIPDFSLERNILAFMESLG